MASGGGQPVCACVVLASRNRSLENTGRDFGNEGQLTIRRPAPAALRNVHLRSMHHMTPVLVTSLSDGIFTIRLNRPNERNALNDALCAALVQACEQAAHDPGARVVVLCAAGPAFARAETSNPWPRPPRRCKTRGATIPRNEAFHDCGEAAERNAEADRGACPRRGGRRRAEPGAGLRFPHRYAERQADHGFRESRLVRGLWRDILPAAHCRSGEGP